MSDIIQLLPDTVANQIAAGEVIQRPASVIKELVENAVDAGATMIQVFVTDAGKTCIQVVDNGCGMSNTDARLAFERHATSKIRKAEDLFGLTTMGFRGEALPSIAAVAQVELRTRMAGEDLGTLLRIEGGKVVEQSVASSPVGSNFSVRNLFFNIPARRKFLKSNTTEMSNILQAFERIALANPQIAFKLHKDGVLMLDLPVGNFRQRVCALFGKRMDSQIVPVNVETSLVNISGYIGMPESARKKGAQQFFFANDRYMRHPYFAKAVATAYDRLVAEGVQVPFFLKMDVDPTRIDVNIHPAKTEIKFEDEQAIWQILLAACREALGKFNAVPTIDFDTENRPDLPLFNGSTGVGVPTIDTDPAYNPFLPSDGPKGSTSSGPDNTGDMPSYAAPSRGAAGSDWDTIYRNALDTPVDSADSQDGQVPNLYDNLPEDDKKGWEDTSADYFQYRGRFIVTAVQSGLMFIDQHRAHIRVLYDRYLSQVSSRKATSHGLLFPVDVTLSPAQKVLFETMKDTLTSVGFEFRAEDDGKALLCGIPAGAEGLDPENLLRSIIEEAAEGNETATNAVAERISLSLARRAAIPEGQHLTHDEMAGLMQQLFAGTQPKLTPDGKPVLVILPDERIEKYFD